MWPTTFAPCSAERKMNRARPTRTMCPASREARNTHSGAMSSGLLRSSRMRRRSAAAGSLGGGTPSVMRVLAEGLMQLTVMPLAMDSMARMRVRATMPSLAAP